MRHIDLEGQLDITRLVLLRTSINDAHSARQFPARLDIDEHRLRGQNSRHSNRGDAEDILEVKAFDPIKI